MPGQRDLADTLIRMGQIQEILVLLHQMRILGQVSIIIGSRVVVRSSPVIWGEAKGDFVRLESPIPRSLANIVAS
jgi:hypothetical protein